MAKIRKGGSYIYSHIYLFTVSGGGVVTGERAADDVGGKLGYIRKGLGGAGGRVCVC